MPLTDTTGSMASFYCRVIASLWDEESRK